MVVGTGPGTGSFFGAFRCGGRVRLKAERCACPLGRAWHKGDSPIFAANTTISNQELFTAAKIGTVPVNPPRLPDPQPFQSHLPHIAAAVEVVDQTAVPPL